MTALLTPPPDWKQRAVSIGGRVLIALALAGVGTLAGRALATDPAWRVSNVVFVGTAHASEAELRHLSDLHSGTHLLRADLDRAVRGVERHPWVQSATARRVYPGEVEIDVVEHQPVLLLALDRLWYVDDQGVPFTPATTSDLDYPVLTGLDPAQASADPELGRAVIAGALRVLNTWDARPASGELPAAAAVSEIHFSPSHGFDLVLRSGSRLIVGFGDPAGPLGKLDRLLAAGLDLTHPQRVDLDMDAVAVATPLPARPGQAPPPVSTPASTLPSPLPDPSSSPAVPGPQGGAVLGGHPDD